MERAARAMALANDDDCFENYDQAVAHRDLMSQESFDDETGAGEEDREHYRKLARAALGVSSSAGDEAREALERVRAPRVAI